MSYIDCYFDKDKDIINVVERDPDGKRVYAQYPAQYVFYYEDPRGKFRSVYGDPLSKFTARSKSEFQKELRLHGKKKLFESDINPVFRCLSDNYLGKRAPKLHTCWFDIETDFSPEKGFAPTNDPFNPVTAISCYLDWLGQLVTLCIPPRHMTKETAQEIASQFDNTFIFDNETDMFNTFFDLIEDADILSGWNSSGYDIPYMVNRVTRVMSKNDTRRFCLWNQLPIPRSYEKFDQVQETYDLVGRVHVDSLETYRKYNYESRHSYKLDFIGEMEVGETKTQYEGTLDQLYNKDWRKFLEYNRQDTLLVYKIHAKLQFLDLANQLAHENTVLFQTVMGSVAMIEMAVINEAHERGLIVPNKIRKNDDEDESQAAGAYVAQPKVGIHESIAAVDLNSLYPSTIRALNMAPETIIGQLRPTLTDQYIYEKGQRLAKEKKKNKFTEGEVEGETGAILWEGLFGSLEYEAVMNQERGTMITIDWERGGSDTASAAEIWKMVFDSNQPWILSANGTIFTYETEGIIPGLLTRWYSERKSIQRQLKAATDKDEQEFLDKRQLVRKILLNSAYGALLNAHCRFYDKRIGQSTTLSGRQIVKHMSAHLNEAICGVYDHTGDSIIYNDTDSAYFTAMPMINSSPEMKAMWTKDTAIQIYDELAENTNRSFPEFMERAFHCPRKNGEIIKAGREIVADRGLFVKKKKYAVIVYDKEGKRYDKDGGKGKLKVTGFDMKRSDTPKFVQVFLEKVLTDVLSGVPKETIITDIKEFKLELRAMDPWTKGAPKGVRKVTEYTAALEKAKNGKGAIKVNMPGHTRASINWNYLCQMNGDNYSQRIVDGMKIVVCKLKDNPLGMTSVAYPKDQLRLPQWFVELPFDVAEMEQVLLDSKIDNMLEVLKWDLGKDTDINSTFGDLFSFE